MEVDPAWTGLAFVLLSHLLGPVLPLAAAVIFLL